MATLQIEHPIRDYDMWRGAFNRLADVRSKAGVIGGRVHRPVDNPNYIVVTLDFDTTGHAVAFLDYLETQIWSSTQAAPALDGRPRTTILVPAPAAVV
jgi:hypothetical protein